MVADDDQTQSPTRNRRSSFAGQTLADLFGGGRPSMSGRNQSENNSPPPQQNLPGPISQAAAQAQQRRMSLTTLGLSGSPNQTSPFGSYRGRRGSVSASTDESAIAEDDSPTQQKEDTGTSPTPFARRTSFGAKALRDRMGSFGGGGNAGQNGTRSPPSANSNRASQNGTISSKGRGLSFAPPFDPDITSTTLNARRHSMLTAFSPQGPSGEGFNWSDNFRNRAQRTSIAGPESTPVGGQSGHGRAKSVAVMEPPPAAAMPPPKEQKRPDHFQERILKGDFYMD